MGLLDDVCATNRKEADRVEASGFGKVPIDRLAEIAPACRISRARVVDTGRIVTAGTPSSLSATVTHGAAAGVRSTANAEPTSARTPSL